MKKLLSGYPENGFERRGNIAGRFLDSCLMSHLSSFWLSFDRSGVKNEQAEETGLSVGYDLYGL